MVQSKHKEKYFNEWLQDMFSVPVYLLRFIQLYLQEVLPYNNTSMDANMITVCFLNVLEHEWMVAQLTKLHDGVHEGLSSTLPLLSFLRSISQKNSLTLHVAVNTDPLALS